MWSPCRHERQEREHLRRHAGRGGERRAAAFERRDALLERRDGRIGDARIDVAERLQVEQARRVVGVVEHERRRLVDRQRARAGRASGICPACRHSVSKPNVRSAMVCRVRCGRLAEITPVLTPAQLRPPRIRACSIFTQRSITTSSPPASAMRAASSLRMPSCIHSTFAPMATASRAIGDDFRRLAKAVDDVDRLRDRPRDRG